MAGLGFRSGAASIAAVWLFASAARAADAPKTPTFTKDIAPIFQAKCESCHRPDSMAPMARYYHPDEFRDLKAIALELGFVHVESGPLVRSSYHAHETADAYARASGS